MDNINRILIFLLLLGLLYALYRYQHIIFGDTVKKTENMTNVQNQQRDFNNTQVSPPDTVNVDNISQISATGSLNDEDGSPLGNIYKPDSILGSLDTGSLFQSEDGGSLMSGDSSFFF